MSITNIAIVGGGACGISAFIELFLQFRIAGIHRQISITIIEENPEVGKGLAFGTRQPGHILNTQADLMGIHLAEPAHFSDWLIEHDKRIGSEVVDNQGETEAFTTRRLYGDYLKEQFEHYFRLAREEGMPVSVAHARVENISSGSTGFLIKTNDNREISSDYVILAPGTPVANNYPHLDGKNNYFDSPWPSSRLLENIPKEQNVGILGSSLSAIDALMTLADNNHRGQITFYSLDGLLPRVQVDSPEHYECKFLTISNIHRIQRQELRNPRIAEIFRLFMSEAEDYAGGKIDWKQTTRTGKVAQELLDEDIAIAQQGGDALMNIPYSLRYQSSDMWKSLDVEEKIRFKKWLGGYWTIQRHGMPIVNAKRVKALFDSGQLKVIPGLKNVSYQHGGFEMEYKTGHASEQYLINATGPASAVKDMKSVLMQNLLRDKFIEPYPAGGLCIDTQTMRIVRNGQPVDGLYALGHVTNGMLLDVNAVWFNVKTIGNLRHHLVNDLISKHAS